MNGGFLRVWSWLGDCMFESASQYRLVLHFGGTRF